MPEPLVVKLVDRNNLPIIDRAVSFKVKEGDGSLSDLPREGRDLTLITNQQGLAQVNFRLGGRHGAGKHQVVASSIGFPAGILFSASAQTLPANRISVSRGNYQTGMMDSALPEPIVARVVDVNGNPVNGVSVKFSVAAGEGSLVVNATGTLGTQLTAQTDIDGNVSAEWLMGNNPNKTGTNSQVVNVGVVGSQGTVALNTKFIATNLKPGPIDNTRVTGIVLDNSNQPLAAVAVTLSGDHFASLRTTTDEKGRFKFLQAPIGTVHLGFDGSTTSRTGEYPKLMYELVTISGQENTVGIPVYIPTLNLEGSKIAGGSQEVIIPMAGVEGAEVIIAPNSVKLPDGRSEGRIMFSQVQTDKVPMPAPHGSVFDVAWTLQPSGTQFNPPARISLPNANGGKPGEEQEMFSFDHDLMEWVSIGPGVVSDDGSRITSREGFGVRHAGWGGAPPPPPPPTCNIKCNDGNECTSDSRSDCFCTNKLIPDKVKSDQADGNCQTELCSGSRDNNGDIPPDSTEAGDCQISGCENGSPTPVDDNGDKPRPEDNPDNFCKTCDEGGIVADASKDDQVLPSDECKVCLNGKAENLEITDVVAKAEGQDEYVTKFVTSGTNVNFTGNATGDNCNFEYEWDFGDGGTSNQQNPTHSYTAAGEYLVEFKVNCQGCPSSEKKDTVKVIVFDVELKIKDAVITLLKENTFTAVVTSPSVSVSSYKFEIHRKTSSTWFELQNNASSTFTDKARVAGKFGVKVIVDVNGVDVESNEEDVEIQFPTYADITSDSFVISASNSAWANTLAAATPSGRREEGFWFTVDTATGKYGKTSTILGPVVANADGASVNIGTRPADSISNPTPLDRPIYTVASFHTHTPTFYRSIGREVGPSPQDNRIDSTVDFIVGIVYDYVGVVVGTKSMSLAGASLNSPAKLYQSGLIKRPTP